MSPTEPSLPSLEDIMLETRRHGNLGDELRGQLGEQDEQLLAGALIGEVVEGAVRAPAGVRHRTAAPAQQSMEGAEGLLCHQQLCTLISWQRRTNVSQEQQHGRCQALRGIRELMGDWYLLVMQPCEHLSVTWGESSSVTWGESISVTSGSCGVVCCAGHAASMALQTFQSL